ncbi:hypothetical protein [Nonomuraea sp. NPDC049480]|uniref:hypothetical protein n=1 Tax=Nonomuraea sp. NPDC049480 TaxID=3364353 RepID=UPI0037AB0D5E
MADTPTPTEYVIHWLQAPEVTYLRDEALTCAERALSADNRNDQWLYLLELRDTIHHPWKYPGHEAHVAAGEHVTQLHDTLTDDQLHSAVDWHAVAKTLA